MIEVLPSILSADFARLGLVRMASVLRVVPQAPGARGFGVGTQRVVAYEESHGQEPPAHGPHEAHATPGPTRARSSLRSHRM